LDRPVLSIEISIDSEMQKAGSDTTYASNALESISTEF